MSKYLLIKKIDSQNYKVTEFDELGRAYRKWMEDSANGFVAKKIDLKVVERKDDDL